MTRRNLPNDQGIAYLNTVIGKRNTRIEIKSYRAGRLALATHDALTAIKLLKIAVEGTAPSDSDLSLYLYWLSIALLRLGRSDLAAKSLVSSQKLKPRSYARFMYDRLVNAYGMVRATCEEHDHFKAFAAIQVKSYLMKKGRNAFKSLEERQAIVRIVVQAWQDLERTDVFKKATCAERLALFETYRIAFPDFVLEPRSCLVYGNFRKGTRVMPDDRCPCGSGLPFRKCCGRTETPREAIGGSF